MIEYNLKRCLVWYKYPPKIRQKKQKKNINVGFSDMYSSFHENKSNG